MSASRNVPGYGQKRAYRAGVLTAAAAEDILAADYRGAPGFLLDKAGSFAAGGTTAGSAYTPAGKSGEALIAASRRIDVDLKYCKYGRSQVMPEAKDGYWASTTQLAFGGQPRKVQDSLWGADKMANRKVPVSAPAGAAGAERARRLEAEAEASPYSTVQHQDLAAAAADAAARAAAKPPLAQPRDAEGQGTSVGRKAVGACAEAWDKDYVQIGLRSEKKP